MPTTSVITGRSVALAALVAAAILTSGTAEAQQVRAEVTVNLNQRAGPSTRFPVITTVPRGNPVTVFGCLSDYTWCDGAYRGQRGWFAARYLVIPYLGTRLSVASYVRYAYVPTVSFAINSYWDRYYQDRPFYGELTFYARGGAVNVSVGSFYRPLQQHGYWTEIRNRRVWVPRVEQGWRPYTEGRWVYSRRYGWTWVSNEPFGWATYHYGRWAYSSRVGWFWVPGTRWAPAWVAWRRDNDYLAWAPLPPEPEDRFGFSITVQFGNIPNYYWRAVRARDFQSDNISNVVIGDNNQIINIVNQTQPAGTVNIVNNVVVNNDIDVTYVEQQTGQTVAVREIALTTAEQENGKIRNDTVEIYHPSEAELVPAEAPEQVIPQEQVAQESGTAGQEGEVAATEELVPPEPTAGEAPPQAAPATETPPMRTEGEQPEPTQPADAGAVEGPLPEGVQACAEGEIRLPDGNCGHPAETAAPPAEEVTPETPSADTPPPAAEGQPPATGEAPAEGQQPAAGEAPTGGEPAAPAEPPAQQGATPGEGEPSAPAEPCPEGTVRQQDGSCGAAQSEPGTPAEQGAPAAPAETPPAEGGPAPETPAEAAPEAPPAAEPSQPEGQAQPDQQAPAQPEPCPEGTVRQQDGSCAPAAVNPPAAAPAEPAQPAPEPLQPEAPARPQPEAPPAPAAPPQPAPEPAPEPQSAPQQAPEPAPQPREPAPQPQEAAPRPPQAAPQSEPRAPAEPQGRPQARCPEGQVVGPQGDCVAPQ